MSIVRKNPRVYLVSCPPSEWLFAVLAVDVSSVHMAAVEMLRPCLSLNTDTDWSQEDVT